MLCTEFKWVLPYSKKKVRQKSYKSNSANDLDKWSVKKKKTLHNRFCPIEPCHMVLSVNLVSLYHRREGSYGTCSFMALWLIYIMAFLSHMIYIRFLLSIDKRLERFHTFTAWWVFRFLTIVNEYSYKKRKYRKNQILESRIGKLLRLFTLSSSFEISLLSCFIIQLNEQLRPFSQLASEKTLKLQNSLLVVIRVCRHLKMRLNALLNYL